MRSILQLLRLPNVSTAVADIAMGYLFVHSGMRPLKPFLCLVMSSAALYMSGTILNDWFDRAADEKLRPDRPIPSGRVSPTFALALGMGLMIVGLVSASAAAMACEPGVLRSRPMIVAALLAAAILLYDGVLKQTLIAPLAMGACRALNILLGMSVATSVVVPPAIPELPLGYDPSQWAVALALGTYVAGITWFARDEATGESRANLIWGMIVMTAGLALLACFPLFEPFASGARRLTFRLDILWPLAVALLWFSTLRRCVLATTERTPVAIQTAVKQCILSLIVFDAAVVMAVCPGLIWPLAVLALMIPFLVLGKWIQST